MSRRLPVLARQVDQISFDRGDTAFVILSSALILFMIPGLAFLYGGLARRKNSLQLLLAVVFSNAVVVFQWYLWGYSLAFSRTATNGFIGNLNNVGLRNVLAMASPGSPLVSELLFSFIQMEFACVTASLLQRGRVMPAMIFSFLWTTLVYCVIAQWAWGINGWAAKWGWFRGLAYAFVLGPRRKRELVNFRPHNVSFVCLGTFILWFGWIGFNAGSAYGANLRAVYAAWNSNICAAMAGLVWCLLDFRVQGKYSMVSFCCGTISGLVASTPSSGFIPAWASIILGIVAGGVCNYATKLKHIMGIDDSLDIFAQHGVGGMLGLMANALFAADYIISLDNVNTTNNCKRIYIQLGYICFDLVPFLQLRAPEEAETNGMDEDQIGEYGKDFIAF
ncbi:hypothetical protein BS47DRAFT_1373206 [Hydnum rufescens UP504]|uniref:Ammonium transporter AmtB-like domain-containing protein n=1 Tax=Hydnum rufescens UP504 TaxID=1448309 RepID=A0A9P6AS82_9AGAM|nr:hypothetical protein BS47DRAFT_1373206 [Hydnum rufescens UP504]